MSTRPNNPKLYLWQPDVAEVPIPAKLQDCNFRLRSLRSLVDAVPDSLVFVRDGDKITFVPRSFNDVPWYNDVGHLILKHFYQELHSYMPEGE